MERNLRKTRVGKVVSNKMDKTIVVAIEEMCIRDRERARRKGKAPERKKIKTGGFVDEIYEDELEPVKLSLIHIYRHHPEPIQDFTVAAGKFCNVLKINVWMVYLDILI